ncbi:hypothetical protein BH11PSE5_BH11PSE5_26620 [soil metagenome]
MSERAPLAAVGFSVGIVGHRVERISDPAAVRARIDEVIGAIDTALAAIAAHAPHCIYARLRLISALAEGADRLAASAALAVGLPLDVVLPFAPAEYSRDFADPSRAEFATLLGRAEAVLILDGNANARANAYDAAGVALLDNCDLLIAVWDGRPARGRGGTREVIEEAARRAMLVVIVSPDGARVTIRSAGPGAGPMRFDDVPEHAITELPGLVAAIAEVGDEAEWRSFAETPREPIIHGAYPLLLELAGVGSKRRRTPSIEAPPADPLLAAFRWWDAAAIRAAQAFRSAVIVNFALAALAVVLAAVSVLAELWKWLFVMAEVATILLLLANTVQAGRRRWQERWLESREVAELLRVVIMMRLVGVGRGLVSPGEGGWISRYVGAFARASAPHAADLGDPATAARPLIEEVAGQAAWNAATARRMHLAAHRIERFGEILFGLVLAAAIGWLLLFATASELAHRLQYPLTAVTAGLPAIATASYGIRIILDFEGIAGRANQIATGLEALLARWEAGPPSAAELQKFARRAADIMLGDVAAWRLLAEGRRLTIPG